MKALPQITEAEYEVMKLFWEKHPISTNEITETLTAVSAWSPKTVQTLIKRLTDKGALTYEKKAGCSTIPRLSEKTSTSAGKAVPF